MKTLMPDECCSGQMETNRFDIESRFLEEVTKMLVESIDINWKDKNLFISILKNYMKDNFNSLLNEYLNYQLTILAGSIIRELDLPDDIVVNVDYAVHAKYNNLIEEIKQKIDVMTRPPSKKKLGFISKVMNSVRDSLEKLSSEQLVFLLIKHDAWFKTFNDPNLMESRNKVKNRDEIIDWICGTDPILEEGGLMSFIEEMKNEGLAI